MKGNRKFRQMRNDDSAVANVVGTAIMLSIMVPIVGSVSFTFTNMMYQQREMMGAQTVMMQNFTEYMKGFKFNQGPSGNNSTTPYVEYEFDETTQQWNFYYCQGHEYNWVKLSPELPQQTLKYTLDIIVTGKGTVTKQPMLLSYPFGTQVQINATPDVGWCFIHWANDFNSIDNPATITMDSDKTVYAVFQFINS